MNRLLWELAILTHCNLEAKDQFSKMGKCVLPSQIDMRYSLGLLEAAGYVVVLLAGPQGPRERTLKEGKNEGNEPRESIDR